MSAIGLRILAAREIWWPIRVSLAADGGTVATEDGEIRVKYPVTRDALHAFSALNGNAIFESIADLVTGWRGPLFSGPDGSTVDFSREALISALSLPSVNASVQVALLEIANGRAAPKNSKTGSAGS